MEELNKFYQNNMKLCLALDAWLKRNNKPFTLSTALAVIYTHCNGNKNKMVEVLQEFRNSLKRKVQGRAQVYADGVNGIDIIKDPNGSGQLIVVGGEESIEKGQHRVKDPTKTKGGPTSKTVVKSREKLVDIGQRIREIYPDKSNYELTEILTTINIFAKRKKKSQDSIVDGLASGKYRLTDDLQQIKTILKPKQKPKEGVSESRTIFINEDVADLINDEIKMTEYKFNSNVKRFLHDLLVDPVNADTSFILKANGLDRKRLMKLLHDAGMIEKTQKISDKNEDGTPKTAVMKVKYSVPKKDFDHKLKKLFISQFESNLGECTAAGAADGGAGDGGSEGYQFITPISGIISQVGYNNQKKKKKNDLDETAASTTVGEIGYDAPAFLDTETARRGDGIGGSTSMNRIRN